MHRETQSEVQDFEKALRLDRLHLVEIDARSARHDTKMGDPLPRARNGSTTSELKRTGAKGDDRRSTVTKE